MPNENANAAAPLTVEQFVERLVEAINVEAKKTGGGLDTVVLGVLSKVLDRALYPEGRVQEVKPVPVYGHQERRDPSRGSYFYADSEGKMRHTDEWWDPRYGAAKKDEGSC
jgi:hypothetical protein